MNLQIYATGLIKSHVDGARQPHPALLDVTLAWTGGTLVFLRGPNGAGKTTLLRILSGLDVPDAGFIQITPSDGLSFSTTPTVLRQWGAYLADRHAFPPRRSLRDCLEEGLILDGVEKQERLRRMSVLGDKFGVSAYWNRQLDQVSKGQLALLNIARLALLDRKCWWLDEPFSGLDEDAARRVCDWMAERLSGGDLVVVCTHQNENPALLHYSWECPVERWSLSNGRLLVDSEKGTL